MYDKAPAPRTFQVGDIVVWETISGSPRRRVGEIKRIDSVYADVAVLATRSPGQTGVKRWIANEKGSLYRPRLSVLMGPTQADLKAAGR